MAISKENARKLEWLFADENKVAFIETFMKIVDKDGNTVPFILTGEQRELVKNLEHMNIISKSRQLGCSSITVALSIRECIVNPNATCVLISHNQSSTNDIFAKLKSMFYSVPEWLRPEITTNNRQAITFASGASITCMTAGNKDCGRGATYSGVVHLSEFAFWKNQEGQMKSIMQAVSSSACVVIESTSNGYNRYSELFLQAKNGENAFKPFFFNWISGRTLFESQYKQSVEQYKAKHNGKMLAESELDEEELQLMSLGATIEQIIWRRDKISVNGLDAFHVEFPSTPEESFLVTGSSVFDKERISKMLISLTERKIAPYAKNTVVGLPQILQVHMGKSLLIWQTPQSGKRYMAGVDCSEGLGKDSHAIIMLNADGEQVARFKNNKIKPYEFADIVDALGRYYNKALLTVEKASGGYSVIERLRYDKHYMNMTKYKTFDEFNRTVWKVGFDTNSKTKSIVVNDFREWFDKGMIKIVDKELLDEMKVFISDDGGKMGAVTGCHDDLVMSACLAIAGMKLGFYYPF